MERRSDETAPDTTTKEQGSTYPSTSLLNLTPTAGNRNKFEGQTTLPEEQQPIKERLWPLYTLVQPFSSIYAPVPSAGTDVNPIFNIGRQNQQNEEKRLDPSRLQQQFFSTDTPAPFAADFASFLPADSPLGSQRSAGTHYGPLKQIPAYYKRITPQTDHTYPQLRGVMGNLDCGQNPENPEETHADMGRTCKLHTERKESTQTKDLNLQPSSYEARVLPTAALCHPIFDLGATQPSTNDPPFPSIDLPYSLGENMCPKYRQSSLSYLRPAYSSLKRRNTIEGFHSPSLVHSPHTYIPQKRIKPEEGESITEDQICPTSPSFSIHSQPGEMEPSIMTQHFAAAKTLSTPSHLQLPRTMSSPTVQGFMKEETSPSCFTTHVPQFESMTRKEEERGAVFGLYNPTQPALQGARPPQHFLPPTNTGPFLATHMLPTISHLEHPTKMQFSRFALTTKNKNKVKGNKNLSEELQDGSTSISSSALSSKCQFEPVSSPVPPVFDRQYHPHSSKYPHVPHGGTHSGILIQELQQHCHTLQQQLRAKLNANYDNIILQHQQRSSTDPPAPSAVAYSRDLSVLRSSTPIYSSLASQRSPRPNPSALQVHYTPERLPVYYGISTPFRSRTSGSQSNARMLLECGRKPENPKETHRDTGRTCKLHTERPQSADLNQDPASYASPTVPLCPPIVPLKRQYFQRATQPSTNYPPFSSIDLPHFENMHHEYMRQSSPSYFTPPYSSLKRRNTLEGFHSPSLVHSPHTYIPQKRIKPEEGESITEDQIFPASTSFPIHSQPEEMEPPIMTQYFAAASCQMLPAPSHLQLPKTMSSPTLQGSMKEETSPSYFTTHDPQFESVTRKETERGTVVGFHSPSLVHSPHTYTPKERIKPEEGESITEDQLYSTSSSFLINSEPGEMEASITTEHFPVTNMLPAPSHLQLNNRKLSSHLLRSQSLPSLTGINCAKNNFTRAKSLPDMLLKGRFEEFFPDITVDGNQETYRFLCSRPGQYQCSVTGLVFHMEAEGDVVYRIVPWNRRLLTRHHKKPAGPLFDIKCLQESVVQLYLPHCEIQSTGGCRFLSVAHVKDDGVEFITPHEVTETHVVIDVSGFSGFGNVKDEDSPPDPVRALVLPFYKPEPESQLNVFLLPKNIVLRDLVCTWRGEYGRYIGTVPHCKLCPKQEYTLSTSPEDDSVLVQPTDAEFDEDYDVNYFPSFQVILEKSMTHIKLFLKDKSSSLSVWERRVCLLSTGKGKSCGLNPASNKSLMEIRTRFIDGISESSLKSLLDKLLEKKLITDAEMESALCEPKDRRDKARFVIDLVRKKGEAASSDMIEFLCEKDVSLCRHLQLI